MDAKKLLEIKETLIGAGYDKSHVDNYVNYLHEASTETKNDRLKNPYLDKISVSKFAFLFQKVASEGIYIDGDTVIINRIGNKIGVSYDYRAYKNRVMAAYPETVFDFQLVKEGDDFSFNKVNGRVEYTHKINDPFDKGREIIGAYGVIKNDRGEFLEIINVDDIAKIRATAKTDYIWKQWTDRMILKSIIKRICKSGFHDLIKGIDKMDNENYELNNIVSLEEPIIEALSGCSSIDEVDEVITEYKDIFIKSVKLTSLASQKKKEIQNS